MRSSSPNRGGDFKTGSSRRSSTPPQIFSESGKTRSRSPRRNGSGRPASEPTSPSDSPRRADRAQKGSGGQAPSTVPHDDDVPFLSSWALPAGNIAGCVCDCEVAGQNRDLMRRFSEKCAQLREAHASRSGIELKLMHLEALGPKGSVRQRLLAADAATTAAQAELRAERQRFQAREAEYLRLLERGKVEDATSLLAQRVADSAESEAQRRAPTEILPSSAEVMLISQGKAQQECSTAQPVLPPVLAPVPVPVLPPFSVLVLILAIATALVPFPVPAPVLVPVHCPCPCPLSLATAPAPNPLPIPIPSLSLSLFLCMCGSGKHASANTPRACKPRPFPRR